MLPLPSHQISVHGRLLILVCLRIQFGEVGIDGSLVAAQEAGTDDIVLLNNGCLCCTVRGDLVRMLGELVDKRRKKLANFDHILIETTGLSSDLELCDAIQRLSPEVSKPF